MTRRRDAPSLPAAWPPELTATLARLWDKGMTASEIAASLALATGRDITRNSILGKVNRLGLPPRAKGLTERKMKPAPPRAERRNPVVRRTKPARPPQWTPPPEPVAEIPIGSVPYLDLRARQCRWILGDAAGIHTVSCCLPTVGSTSWCLDHLERVSAPGTASAQIRTKAA